MKQGEPQTALEPVHHNWRWGTPLIIGCLLHSTGEEKTNGLKLPCSTSQYRSWCQSFLTGWCPLKHWMLFINLVQWSFKHTGDSSWQVPFVTYTIMWSGDTQDTWNAASPPTQHSSRYPQHTNHRKPLQYCDENESQGWNLFSEGGSVKNYETYFT